MLLGPIEYLLISFVALFVIVNPLTTAFIFQSLMPYGSRNQKKLVAKRAAIVALTILVLFSLFGNTIFQIFGVTIPAFKIAGGLILFGIGMKMLKNHEGEHDEEHHTSSEMDSEDISVVPLAIPFMSGPGTIATTVLLTTQAENYMGLISVLIAIFLVIGISYFAMMYSNLITEKIGSTGKRIITKIFGLILAVISVQFVIDGIIEIAPKIF